MANSNSNPLKRVALEEPKNQATNKNIPSLVEQCFSIVSEHALLCEDFHDLPADLLRRIFSEIAPLVILDEELILKFDRNSLLDVSSCLGISQSGFLKLCETQSTLTSLSLASPFTTAARAIKQYAQLIEKSFPNLLHLNLSGCRITTKECGSLRKLKKLQSLDLSFTKVNDSCLEMISNIKTLVEINLEGCKHFTDAGLFKILSSLNLKKLNIRRTHSFGKLHQEWSKFTSLIDVDIAFSLDTHNAQNAYRGAITDRVTLPSTLLRLKTSNNVSLGRSKGPQPSLQVLHCRGNSEFQINQTYPQLQLLDAKHTIDLGQQQSSVEQFALHPTPYQQLISIYVSKFNQSPETTPLALETVRLFFERITEPIEARPEREKNRNYYFSRRRFRNKRSSRRVSKSHGEYEALYSTMLAAFQTPKLYLPKVKKWSWRFEEHWEGMLHLWKYYSQFIHKEVDLEEGKHITNQPKWIWTQQQFQYELLQLFYAMFRCLRASNIEDYADKKLLSEFMYTMVTVALKYMPHPEIQITCAGLLKEIFDKLKPEDVDDKLAIHILKLFWHWQVRYINTPETAEAARTIQCKIIPMLHSRSRAPIQTTPQWLHYTTMESIETLFKRYNILPPVLQSPLPELSVLKKELEVNQGRRKLANHNRPPKPRSNSRGRRAGYRGRFSREPPPPPARTLADFLPVTVNTNAKKGRSNVPRGTQNATSGNNSDNRGRGGNRGTSSNKKLENPWFRPPQQENAKNTSNNNNNNNNFNYGRGRGERGRGNGSERGRRYQPRGGYRGRGWY